MQFSVVIPLYNKEPHIGRALESVLAQTKPPGEIIVVNDGSTDAGPGMVQSINDPRLRLINQTNQGVSAARNRGIAEASGEVIAFLDADDAWEPRFLEVISSLRKKYPQAGAYATAYRVITPAGLEAQRTAAKISGLFFEPGLIGNYFQVALDFPVWTSAVAVPQNVLQEIGGFQTCEVQEEDVDAWLRIALHYPLAWSPEKLAVYYQDAGNRATGFQRWTGEPITSRTAKQALAKGLLPPDQVQDLQEYAAHFQIAAARDCLVIGKKETAVQLLEYARGTKRFTRQWWKWRLLATLPQAAGPWLWKQKQRLQGRGG